MNRLMQTLLVASFTFGSYSALAGNASNTQDAQEGLVQDESQATEQSTGTTTKKNKSNKENLNFGYTKIQNILSSHFGNRIRLQRSMKGNGKIVIPFENDDDLNRILELLNY